MNTAIIITVTICVTLFLSLAALLFAAVKINKHNRSTRIRQINRGNSEYVVGVVNKTQVTEGDDDGKL